MEIVRAGKGVRSEVRRGPGNEKENIEKLLVKIMLISLL
jgi:hypothetical protein